MPQRHLKTRFAAALLTLLCFARTASSAGEVFTLRRCIDYAVQHNARLCTDRLSMEEAVQARREVLGAFLPQITASAGLVRNFQKTTVAMPNFIASMMPESMRDPNAPKYMTVTMGMNYNANYGVQLSQQLLNLQLMNAMKIARLAEDLSTLGTEATTEEVIAQTAALYFGIRVMSIGAELFDEALSLMDRTIETVEASGRSGLVREVDIKQIRVSRSNLESEKQSMLLALEIQKNLLKLQMGLPMEESIEVDAMSPEELEALVLSGGQTPFEPERLLPYRMFSKRQQMVERQYSAALYETLPVLSLGANYALNYMGDAFRGETFRHFPVSSVSLSLRVPLFTGLSKSAGIKKADIERKKALIDGRALEGSLSMAYANARASLERSLETMYSQKRNCALAREALELAGANYAEGLSPLADLLNANSALISSRSGYINALGACLNAHIELKKTDGTIKTLF